MDPPEALAGKDPAEVKYRYSTNVINITVAFRLRTLYYQQDVSLFTNV